MKTLLKRKIGWWYGVEQKSGMLPWNDFERPSKCMISSDTLDMFYTWHCIFSLVIVSN